MDIEKDPDAAEIVRHASNGEEITPAVEILGGLYVEPTEAELSNALRASGLMA